MASYRSYSSATPIKALELLLSDPQGTDLLKQVSPVAWQHINLHGRYEFSKRPEHININAIIQELAQTPFE